MEFFKVKSFLTRPDTNTNWFSTGDTLVVSDNDFYYHIKHKYSFRSHLILATDLINVKDLTNVPTRVDDVTLTWTRVWYQKKYRDEFHADPYIRAVLDREQQYWDDHGIKYLEQHSNIPAKMTSNGRPYLGNYYLCRTDLNSDDAINN